MERSTRRRFLRTSGVVATVGLAGCSGILDDGDEIKDTDGDGVIDSEDYAPRDASVQRAEQVKERSPTEAETPTKTERPTETDTATATETQTPSEGSLQYTWESGAAEGWRRTNVRYGSYVAEFNITSESPIAGSYSAQTEALNDRLQVANPSLNQQLTGEAVASVAGTFRLTGDVSANGMNHNAIVLRGTDNGLKGRLLFYHGGTELRWNTGENPPKNSTPRVLQSYTPGEEYDIEISAEGQSFSVNVNGRTYSDLPVGAGSQAADISQFKIDCRNSTGPGPSIYDGPIYFTWDNLAIQLE